MKAHAPPLTLATRPRSAAAAFCRHRVWHATHTLLRAPTILLPTPLTCMAQTRHACVACMRPMASMCRPDDSLPAAKEEPNMQAKQSRTPQMASHRGMALREHYPDNKLTPPVPPVHARPRNSTACACPRGHCGGPRSLRGLPDLGDPDLGEPDRGELPLEGGLALNGKAAAPGLAPWSAAAGGLRGESSLDLSGCNGARAAACRRPPPPPPRPPPLAGCCASGARGARRWPGAAPAMAAEAITGGFAVGAGSLCGTGGSGIGAIASEGASCGCCAGSVGALWSGDGAAILSAAPSSATAAAAAAPATPLCVGATPAPS